MIAAGASASPLAIELAPAAGNPSNPRMGDHLMFRGTITNTGSQPLKDVFAWLSLVQVDPGQQQPIDLEDWSAHKAATVANLAPGAKLEVDWPLRLIQQGHYRLMVSALARGSDLVTSPLVDFAVQPKPVVESSRVLPIACGIPLLLLGLLFWRSDPLSRMSSASPFRSRPPL